MPVGQGNPVQGLERASRIAGPERIDGNLERSRRAGEAGRSYENPTGLFVLQRLKRIDTHRASSGRQD